MSEYLSFKLHDEFISKYAKRKVNWGFEDAGTNSLGEVTFFRTYSRRKDDGTKERWHEVCRRVIEGTYSILKDHTHANKLPWSEKKAQTSAMEAYERMFDMKWLPPGRGLWMMGTKFVNERQNSSALQNCAFVSTGDMTKFAPEQPFIFLMEASMLGIGVGFDTEGASRGVTIHAPVGEETFTIPDSREGWVESVGMQLRSYLTANKKRIVFDYSLIRPSGEPIRGFGGTAAGPGPLIELHEALDRQFWRRSGQPITSTDIVDVMNHIGRCVVAGNVRRSAELALGSMNDNEFLNLKNYEKNPHRAEYGWVSNNSVSVKVGDNYDEIVPRIVDNGEPGLIYLDVTRSFGRLIDGHDTKDERVKGFNPCAEQPLESYEMCTLVETFPTRCDDKADFERTLKYAYLYAKAVTLMPTHWPETNAVMQRNRRIGCSVSGMAEFVDTRGWTDLRTWLNDGYSVVRGWDKIYSEWLGVRESVRVTTVKPSGSVSLVAGVTPGAHWPTHDTYIRRIRMGMEDPLLEALEAAGYHTELANGNEKTTKVVELLVRGKGIRTEREVTLFEKTALAVLAQRYWSDNGVSLTLTFNPETEGKHIGNILRIHEGQLKALSFLPIRDGVYKQMPYEYLSEEGYKAGEASGMKKLNWTGLYKAGDEALGEAYCSTDVCDLPLTQPDE